MAKPSVKVKVDIKPDLAVIAEKFRKDRKKYIYRQIKDLSRKIYYNIRSEAPVRTGALRKSIVERKRSDFFYEIMVDYQTKGGKYELFVRLGVPASRINPIRAVRKRALYWPGARHPVKAVYRHPGIKPNPYWDRGLEKSRDDINRTESLIASEMEADLL